MSKEQRSLTNYSKEALIQYIEKLESLAPYLADRDDLDYQDWILRWDQMSKRKGEIVTLQDSIRAEGTKMYSNSRLLSKYNRLEEEYQRLTRRMKRMSRKINA